MRLLPWQPADRLAESLGVADLHIATMAEGAEGLLVPSKVAGALAAGRPCVLLGPDGGAAARILSEGRCGSVLAPGDGLGLARVILEHARDPALHAEACARATAAAAAWTVEHAASDFLALAARVARPVPLPGITLPNPPGAAPAVTGGVD